MSENAEYACMGCGICTFICYAIGVALGWVFSKVTVPDNAVALAGAIIITLPVFMVIGATMLECFCGNCQAGSDGTGGCVACAAFAGGVLSGIFDIVGLILFIVAMVGAGKELDDPAGAITCGVFASIFVLVAAITNFATIISYNMSEKTKEPVKEHMVS